MHGLVIFHITSVKQLKFHLTGITFEIVSFKRMKKMKSAIKKCANHKVNFTVPLVNKIPILIVFMHLVFIYLIYPL